MRALGVLLALVGAIAVGFGLPRLDLQADLFELLPDDSPQVDALRRYQENFGSSNELILTLRARDADVALSMARSLAERLEDRELSDEVIWRDPLRENPDALGQLLAWIWLNRPPQEVEALAERFRPEAMTGVLESTLDRLATSLSPEEVARLANDPYALTDFGRRGDANAFGEGDAFASEDGTFRVLFVEAPLSDGSFAAYQSWIDRVRSTLLSWQGEWDPSPTVRITGHPAFVADTGTGLLSDTRRAAIGTLLFVALLFWLAHRRWAPLLWMVTLLLVVLAATIGLGSLFFGSLHVASLGFAAILLGLAVDYALILFQELRSDPALPVAEHRRVVAPGILWAAITTAGAFFMITRSSLPGLSQLGVLVACGILLAAATLLLAFLPPIAGAERRRPHAPAPRFLTPGGHGFRWTWGVTVGAGLLFLAILAVRQPGIDVGTDELGPLQSEPRDALAEIEREIGRRDRGLWLVVEGESETEVAERLDAVAARLDRAVEEDVVTSVALPRDLWPRPTRQQRNRMILEPLLDRLPEAQRAATEMGFTAEAMNLTDNVFEGWRELLQQSDPIWPTAPGVRWLFRQFSSHSSNGLLALGGAEAEPEASSAALREVASDLRSQGTSLFAWSLLSESLLDLLRRDVARVLLPMTGILLLLLAAAFRRAREVALSVASLAFSLLALSAAMAVIGWSWNLMNIMALPLLFGAGVDYSIHIQLALRRHGGDVRRVLDSVGRAILLCGASTVAGFSSLGLASNAGLASLGRVAALGVALTALTCVFLLPTWWHAGQGLDRERS